MCIGLIAVRCSSRGALSMSLLVVMLLSFKIEGGSRCQPSVPSRRGGRSLERGCRSRGPEVVHTHPSLGSQAPGSPGAGGDEESID